MKANRQIAETAEAAGVKAELIPDWHPNQLRHTRATEVRKQFGLEAAQVVLGHAKADVTAGLRRARQRRLPRKS